MKYLLTMKYNNFIIAQYYNYDDENSCNIYLEYIIILIIFLIMSF